ncbi:MAG: trypsin-like peptidase domain-containing protein [Planctomycetaceae bacterium]
MRFLFALSITLFCGTAVADPQVQLLDFTASWCRPCQSMQPILDRMSRAGYSIHKIDIGNQANGQWFRQYKVSAMPTLIILVNGKEYRRFEGKQDEGLLRASMDEAWRKQQRLTQDSQPGSSAGANTALPVGAVVRAQSPDPANPLSLAQQATVRVRVAGQHRDDGQSIRDTGTGTIVYSKQKESLILTCAHLFADLAVEKTEVAVDVFAGTTPQTFAADVICGSNHLDLAVLRIRPNEILPAVAVTEESAFVEPGQTLTSIGCNDGAAPTKELTGLIEADRIPGGPPHLICSRDPARGRSGGGLYDRNGKLIGICSMALRENGEGLFMAAAAIRALMEEHELTFVVQKNSGNGQHNSRGRVAASAASDLFDSAPVFDNAGPANPVAAPFLPANHGSGGNAPPQVVQSTAGVGAAPDLSASQGSPIFDDPLEANESSQPVSASQVAATEVTVIVDSANPGGEKRVIVIPHAAAWLLELLQQEAGNNLRTEPLNAAATDSGDRPVQSEIAVIIDDQQRDRQRELLLIPQPTARLLEILTGESMTIPAPQEIADGELFGTADPPKAVQAEYSD